MTASATLFEGAFHSFWTAYDPLDLATDSIDPLGFLAGYVRLADQLLPGVTTVTNVPRYVSLLCAAAAHAEKAVSEDSLGPRERRRARLAHVKAFERAWALGCALASRDPEVGEAAVQGLRGIRSIERRLKTDGTAAIALDSFNMLTNQERYGCWGVYASMAESCHLLSIDDVELTAPGRAIAATFPPPFFKITPDAVITRSKLRDWGLRAHLAGLQNKWASSERKAIREALKGGELQDGSDQRRWTTIQAIARVGENARNEQDLLKQVRESVSTRRIEDLDHPGIARGPLAATLDLVFPFEVFYRSVLFLFQYLQATATDGVRLRSDEQADDALHRARLAARRLESSLVAAQSLDAEVERDARAAFDQSGLTSFRASIEKCASTAEAFALVLDRHEKVQRGKLDGGVPKAPWLIQHAKGGVRLTAQRFALPAGKRPRTWKHVDPHPYRTFSATAFIRACEVTK